MGPTEGRRDQRRQRSINDVDEQPINVPEFCKCLFVSAGLSDVVCIVRYLTRYTAVLDFVFLVYSLHPDCPEAWFACKNMHDVFSSG